MTAKSEYNNLTAYHSRSIPVIPTERKPKLLIFNSLGFFCALNWRDFGVITIFNGLSAVIQYFGIMFSL